MSESTQAQLDALRSNATDSEGRPLIEMNLKTGRLSLRGVGIGQEPSGASEFRIDPGQAVKPLRMGKFTFYGETARQIREAQEILGSAGAGQLEVVKRANECGEPHVVIDGQVFINKATVDEAFVDPARVEINTTIKTATTDAALKVMAGLISERELGSSLADAVRQVIREELQPGRLLGRRR